jgi:hypothetical protein
MTKFGPWKVWWAGGGRLEVHRVERVWVDVAVPAHDVERVAVEDVALVTVAHAQRELVLAVGLDGLELGRAVEVALGVRGVLEQLAVAVAVAVGRLDLAGRVEADPELLDVVVQAPAVRGPARDDDVVLLAEGHRPEHRVQDAAAAVDVDDLVALAVAVEALVGLGRLADRRLDVVVEHQQAPAADGVAARVDRVGVRQPVHVGVGHPLLADDRVELADLRQPARRVQVVEDRLVAGEALVAEDLLGQKRAVTPRLGVALGGNVAEADVAHRCPPRGCRAAPARARWLRTGP